MGQLSFNEMGKKRKTEMKLLTLDDPRVITAFPVGTATY